MDSAGGRQDNTATGAEQHEPAPHQFFKNKERTGSPRVIVYDCEKNSLQVRSKQEVDKDPNKPDYKAIHLPRRMREVTIFVDPETESEPTTEHITEGHSNVMLVKLYLDRLGTWNQILRCTGQLSTLYVKPWSETASSYS